MEAPIEMYTRVENPRLRNIYMVALLKGTAVVAHFAGTNDYKAICGVEVKKKVVKPVRYMQPLVDADDGVEGSLFLEGPQPKKRLRRQEPRVMLPIKGAEDDEDMEVPSAESESMVRHTLSQ